MDDFISVKDYGLSNMEHDGWIEKRYQAEKCLYANEKQLILNCKNGYIAKRLGKTITLRPDWNKIKKEVMYKICKDFYTNNIDAKSLLLSTGNIPIVEDNWWGDRFWGVCKSRGTNHLGKILMQIRKELNNGLDELFE